MGVVSWKIDIKITKKSETGKSLRVREKKLRPEMLKFSPFPGT